MTGSPPTRRRDVVTGGRRALVVAPHPDDEVLGSGGLIRKLVESGWAVDVLIVTKAMPPLFDEQQLQLSRAEARAAHDVLGVTSTRFLEFPAAGLDGILHRELNAALVEDISEHRPELLLLPFGGDLHIDHQRTFLSGMVASRPSTGWTPATVLLYETLSETNWNAPYITPAFAPTVFVDITAQLERKLQAMACYRTQLRPFPNERSIDALRATAMSRGATIGVEAAEAFVLVRALR